MKISSNYTYKPNFGYDKQLNKELKQELDNHQDKKWASTLGALNTYCNRLETQVQKLEKEQKSSDSKYHDYLDIFLTSKGMLAGFVSITFDGLNFADREYKHYQDEFVKNGSKENDWRKDAVEAIEEWVSPDIVKASKTDSSPKKNEPYVPKFDEEGAEIVDNSQKTQQPPSTSSITETIMSKLSPKSFLEEFRPDSSTPKGFLDVAGMDDLKRDLNESIIQFIQNPEQAKLDFEDYGKTIPKGILLYGPPGCGKTYITQALSSEIEVPLYLLNISKAGSHYINMTSKNIKAAFDEAIAIAQKSDKPCLVFMDEIDSLAFDRSSRMEPDDLKQVATMLLAIDDAKKSNVIIIGATNKYNLLDPAIRRRFDSKVLVDVPDEKSRKALILKNLSSFRKGQKLMESDSDIEQIVKQLVGYSSDSICKISKAAALNAMRRDRSDIQLQDFEKAIKETTEEKPDRKLYLADALNKNKIGF